jgi:DNA-binding transcriptional LysR family regulator
MMQAHDVFAIFAKVGETGSISGAARALGLPKANVSRAVTRMESDYKVKLIDRTTQRLALTEAGRLLHTRCLRVISEMAEASAELAAQRGTPAGTLRIGCPPDVARGLLTPHLHEFLQRYPDIDLRVRVGERLLPEPHSLDVVVHSGWLSDSRLTVRRIAEVTTLLIASQAYVQQHGEPKTIESLSSHPVIGNFYLDSAAVEPGRLPAHVPPLELVREAERHPVHTWSRFASTDHSQLLELVKRGVAIAPLAAIRVVTELTSGELVWILPEYPIAAPPALYALYTERAAMVPKLRVFLDFITELVERQRAEVMAVAPALEAAIGKSQMARLNLKA